MRPGLIRGWRRTGGIAAGFWLLWLALAAAEVGTGDHPVLSVTFLVSLPALVGLLTWAYRGVVLDPGRRPSSVLVLGAVVLGLSSAITIAGLAAAVGLQALLRA